jgi:hypothetical protein
VRDKLLGMLFLTDDMLFDEVSESLSVRSMVEMEVETLTKVLLFDVDDLISCVMLDDHLFEEQECSLVINLLSNLDLRLPQMRGVSLFTSITLQIGDNILNYECLL